MKLTMVAKNFKFTNSIKEYINKKLTKINKYIDNPEIKVISEVSKFGHKFEVTIFDGDTLIKSECTESDLYVAIDKVMDKLKNQLERYSDKKVGFRNESIRGKKNPLINKIEDDELRGMIVKRKVFNLKPMFESEAILQMEMLGHNSFMFFNEELETICLLYKRKDGNYGIIETE